MCLSKPRGVAAAAGKGALGAACGWPARLPHVCYYAGARPPGSNRRREAFLSATVAIKMRDTQETFRRGLELFNRCRFFEAHEIWETIWLAAPESEKTFLQGLIQVAAAFHHYARGNRAGALSLLEAGLQKLEGFPAHHHGIDNDGFCRAVRRWVAVLSAGEDPVRENFPRVCVPSGQA